MTRIAAKYERPQGTGMYATLHATLGDGRTVTINTQYSTVQPHDGHIPTIPGPGKWDRGTGCPQLTQMGGRCTCAANADIMAMADALVAEARAIGHAEADAADQGQQPMSSAPADIAARHGDGWCDKCESYCYGDCTAANSY